MVSIKKHSVSFFSFIGLSTFYACSTYAQEPENWLKSQDLSWLNTQQEQSYAEEISPSSKLEVSSNAVSTQESIKNIARENPNKIIDIAFDFLERGIFDQAERLFSILEEDPEYTDVSLYGKGLILSQKGAFEESYALLNTITPQHINTEDWLAYKNRLTLFIAAQLYEKKKSDMSYEWLQKFDPLFATAEDKSFANRLYTKMQASSFQNDTERLRVGLLLPLTGTLKPIGKDMLKAAQLAVFDAHINNIYIYPQDTKGSQEGALHATEAVFQDGAQVIVGPLLSENTAVSSDIARYRRTSLISFSSHQDVANKTTFLLSFLPEKQAEHMASYATNTGIKTVAALVPQTPYGEKMLASFKASAEKQGLIFKREAFYTPGATDHKKALDYLGQMPLAQEKFDLYKDLLEHEYALLGEAMDDASLTAYKDIQNKSPEAIVDFDALFLPAAPKDIPLLTSQMAFYDMDASQITLMGTGQWQDTSIKREKTDYVRGARFPGSGDKTTQNAFRTHFKEIYGYEPHPIAILAYDAITLLSEARQEDGAPLEEALTRIEGFNLASGLVRFNKKGLPEHYYRTFKLGRTTSYTEDPLLLVMPPKLPEPLNPLKRTRPVFNFFQKWRF